MSDIEISNIGIPFLDSMLGGGFLSNSIVVISYQPGTKIRQFGVQMGLKKYEEKLHTIIVTFHYSIKEFIDWVKVSLTNPELYKKIMGTRPIGSLSVIDCFSIAEGDEDSKIGDVHNVSNPFNVDNLLSVMAKVRENIPKDTRVYWVFYDLTNMSIGVPENDLVKFCRRAFRYYKQQGDLAFYYLNEKAHTDMFFAKLYQLSDVFIKLLAEETPRGLENCVQVIKGVFPFESKKVFFEINENGEIQVVTNKLDIKSSMPAKSLSTVGYFESGKDLEYSKVIRTGIPMLDSLLGGGILSNSIVVVSHQYGVRFLEPSIQMFQNQFGEKTHIILFNFHFPSQEYEPRLKMLLERSEVHKSPEKSLSYGNVSVIDCFNTPQSETDTQEGYVYYPANPFDVDRLISAMTRVRNDISESKSVFWIFYSLTDMSIGIPEDELIKFCRRAFRYHKHCGDLALYALTEQAHSERFRAKLYQLSDVFIKIVGEDKPEGIETSLQVLKGSFYFNSKKTRYQLDEKSQIQFVED
nr:hypothetical protein [Candidatus Freyarchaeota archaeon]